MLSVDLSHALSFLPPAYETALRPGLEQAAEWLRSGGGKGADYIGWVDLPVRQEESELARIEAAARRIRETSRALVVIGIGGSYLGAHGVIDCLCSPNYNLRKKTTPNVYFVGNHLSSDALREVMELVGEDDFSVNVISKSGTTTEPAVAFRFFREMLEARYGHEGAARRIYATTDRSRGALRAMAEAEGYETFVIPDDVGGRYSVLSPVGLLPVAAAGVDIRALLAGAQEMRTRCLADGFENPAWQYAAARSALYRSGKKIELLACFEPCFHAMAEWWKQLYGESEGKDGRGLFPAGADFTTDLHSMGQYIQDGERTLLETVVRYQPRREQAVVPFVESNGDGLNFLAGRTLGEINARAADGTLLAHVQGGVPNIVIRAGENDERTMGELIYFFEYACGLSGYLLGVNPFDQPGVEAYKKNMFALMGKPGYEELSETLRAQLAAQEKKNL